MPLTGGLAAFRRIVLSAALAGLLTGLLITVLLTGIVVPLILEAEKYEQAAPAAVHAETPGAAHHGATGHGADEPPHGIRRALYTATTSVLMAVGYGLLLGACFSRMRSVNWRKGIALGIAGFLVFQLAPAIGLPPVLPGVPSAELGPRQLWWAGTVLATALGIASLYLAWRKRGHYWWPVGLVLIALPHVIGAPQADVSTSPVPASLARDFAIASVLVAAIFWLVLGAIQGCLFARFSRQS